MGKETNEQVTLSFPITVLGDFSQISPTISLARARIFYKGLNRNATYISDDFAEKLISTIPFSPVKGIYVDDDDNGTGFTDHGASSSLGKVYGFVPKEYNLKWEDHEDEDGIIRTYATVDVILWTALYKEAKTIVGQNLSMEIYKPSIKGQWTTVQGFRVFTFEEGQFFGLQILGDQYEPCFEGAGFFSLYSAFADMYKELDQYRDSFTKGGLKEMPMNFKLSDREKYDLLWKALNPNYTQEGNWEVVMGINDIFDDYALCYNYEEHQFYRVYFTKTDDNVEVTSTEKRFIVDVSEDEYSTLNSLRTSAGANNYTELAEKFTTMTASIADKDAKFTQLQTEFDEFKAAQPAQTDPVNVEEYTTKITDLEGQVKDLTAEAEGLKAYKLSIEGNEKTAIIEKYKKILPANVMEKYTEEVVANYTVDALSKDLAVDYVNATPTLFTEQTPPSGFTLRDDTPATGVNAILDKYKNKTN